MVMGDDSCLSGRWFESLRHRLDGQDIFHNDLLKNLYCLLEKTENERKRGRD